MPERVSNALLLGLGIVVAIALATFWPIPVKAQDCVLSLEQGKANLEAAGGTWLGEYGQPAFGLEDARLVYYIAPNGIIYMSVVYPGGCMWPHSDLPVGPPEDKGAPA